MNIIGGSSVSGLNRSDYAESAIHNNTMTSTTADKIFSVIESQVGLAFVCCELDIVRARPTYVSKTAVYKILNNCKHTEDLIICQRR